MGKLIGCAGLIAVAAALLALGQYVPPGGSTGGGAPTTSKYILGAADGTLTSSVVNYESYFSPAVAPASAGSFDDEFNGSALSGSWTWDNQGSGGSGATATVGKSRVALAGVSQGGYNMHSIFQATPGATPWEVTNEMTSGGVLASTFNFAGLILRESGTDKRSLIALDGQNLQVSHWSSASSGPTSVASVNFVGQPRVFLRIRDDGSNLIYFFSIDDVYFQQLYSEAITAAFTTAPNQLGLSVVAGANNNVNVVLSCDWFRRTL